MVQGKSSERKGSLIWDDLADAYKKHTGRNARIQPMDKIMDWAEKRTDLFYFDEDGYLYHKDTKGEK